MKKASIFVLCAILAVLVILAFRPDGNALIRIVESRCDLQAGSPKVAEPCLKADPAGGYVILRDRKGPRHYLLLPTQPLPGIESALLLDPSTPNYFRLAWENRHLLSDEAKNVPDTDVLLAVNSRFGRSQNRLHVHISCISPEVRSRLDLAGHDSNAWQPVRGGLLSNAYWVRRVEQRVLYEKSAFRLLADDFPVSADEMGQFSLAMTKARNGDFLLLATRVSLADLNLASSGELQDHRCGS
ncbi:CDP-diacylglycerol diphosphatase [Pseudomonas sp. R2.Fl]|nr:CDP-diacylglycerol diphosphatase [Pseudomonas sp. R2.Fl]